jgi:hypothetical protein
VQQQRRQKAVLQMNLPREKDREEDMLTVEEI